MFLSATLVLVHLLRKLTNYPVLPNPEPDPKPWFSLFGSNPVDPVPFGFEPPNPPAPKFALAAFGSTEK